MAASCPKEAPQKKPKVKAPLFSNIALDFSKKVALLGNKRRREGDPSRQPNDPVVIPDTQTSITSSGTDRSASSTPSPSFKDPLVPSFDLPSSLFTFASGNTQEMLPAEEQRLTDTKNDYALADPDSQMDCHMCLFEGMNLDGDLPLTPSLLSFPDSSQSLPNTQIRIRPPLSLVRNE